MELIRMNKKIKRTSIRARLTAGLLVIILLAGTFLTNTFENAHADSISEKILSFERVNPVYTDIVDAGTMQEELNLPSTLRAVCEIKEETVDAEMEESEFRQTAPVPDAEGDYDYYWHGYVAPQNLDELYESGELAVYTIYYADETEAYRVHGSWEGQEEGFYACDENGEITGIIKEVPVTWNCEEYETGESGTYTFTAQIADEYDYDGEMPKAEITVKESSEGATDVVTEEVVGGEAHDHDEYGHDEYSEEMICTCGAITDKHDENCVLYTPECTCGHADAGHVKGCPLWNPECTCPEEALGHSDESCPYYVPLSDCDCGIDEDSRPWEHQEGCIYFGSVECTCEGGVHDSDNRDCLKHVAASTYSINDGGVYDRAGDELMTVKAKTSGNDDYSTTYSGGIISGIWADYINTIWMNKAYNEFAWTADVDTGAYKHWVWGGAVAGLTTNDVETNALRIPAATSGVWRVYSGEQLLYALLHLTAGDTISLGGNINLNGRNCNWYNNLSDGEGVDLKSQNVILEGNGHTIYNLGIATSRTTAGRTSFIRNCGELTVKNLTFATAKFVSPESSRGGIFDSSNTDTSKKITDVEIKDSLIFGKEAVSPFGRVNTTAGGDVLMTRCYTNGNYIYGGSDHVVCFISSAANSEISYSGAYDNLACGLGGHSAGFLSCLSGTEDCTIKNSFASNEIYGTTLVSGFLGAIAGTFTNCYSSGKLEGYSRLGGFLWNGSTTTRQTISNCYSTTLVGLRKRTSGMTASNQQQGGFAFLIGSASAVNDCYAAGEVGDYDVDLGNPVSVGGFAVSSGIPAINCYYDKQTTAMREWVAGDAKTTSGVTGVLTSTTGKAGTGLASGTVGGSSDLGFKGFSDNSQWAYTPEHYPQLAVFADASAAAWGSADRANAVKAWSLAATSTVFLDTWDKGYDWDADGVRSVDVQSYDRILSDAGKASHAGNRYTYDTVREIVTDFKATNIGATDWSQMIPGGALTKVITSESTTPVGNSISISAGKGKVNTPGLDWYKVSETVNGQTGYRPLRLIAYMNVEAGADKDVASGELYNHRSDVGLTMMDTITENLVVGLDDSGIWSTAVTQPYPDTVKYYATPTTPTSFSASQDAWVYTEIWRAQKDSSGSYVLDADGGYVPEYSVNVTGPGTGSNTTIDEQKWNGEEPIYADTSVGHKYIITYYWMLADGRYRTDEKVVTITPGKYDVAVNVYNAKDNTANSTALYTGAAPDSGASTAYSFGAGTSAHAETLNSTYTTNVTAAWKKDAINTKITKMAVTMTALDGTTVMGSADITGDIKAGDTITIPVKYLYLTTIDDLAQGKREVTEQETVNITYTIETDPSGGYYLRFNKLANVPSNEVPSAYAHGDNTGIPAGTKAYINDLSYNIQIDLYVEEAGELTVEKELTAPAEEEETFVFQVDYCGNDTEAGSVERTMYAVITIPAGETTGTAKFVEIPAGWYMVTELNSNWRFELLVDELDNNNPDAVIDGDNAGVTMHIEGNSPIYVYQNNRLDVPWVNGKSSVTNDMPPVSQYE